MLINCFIYRPVKNCGNYLLKVPENIEKISSILHDYKIIIYNSFNHYIYDNII